ncbi:MAG: PD40 domain-containing protein, partial [Gemmatimonadota bacterium]
MRRITVVTLTFLFLLTAANIAVAQDGRELFQQALVKERANGDFRGAIEIYERIVREFATDRALAARALVQMGRCHEMLGSEEAQHAYGRVLQEYGDQTEMAEEARVRLTALQRLAASPVSWGIVVREVAFEGHPSPDGQRVVYTDWSTNDIAVRDIRTDEVRRLTTTGTQLQPMQFGMDAAFSPDDRYVAYEWHHPDSKSYYDLRIVPADGSGPPRVLYDTAGFYMMGPAWSRDGKHIAVARYPDDDSRTALLWVSVADGAARVLDTYTLSTYQGISHSPDDRYVVYSVRQGGEPEQHDIHIAATDGGGSHPIVQDPADDRLLGWVPDTDWVLFLSNRSNVWGAWALEVVSGIPQGPPRLVHPGMGQAGPAGFTSAGDLYYSLPVRWFTAYVAPFDRATGQVDTTAARALQGSTMSPAWSPDGSRVAYLEEQSNFQGTVSERLLRVVDVTTGDVRQLADHLNARPPRWSPDGNSIVVSAYDDSDERSDYHGAIYQVDVETGSARFLRPLPGSPAWWNGTAGAISPDGESLFYLLRAVEKQGDQDGVDGIIGSRNLAAGTEQELYRSPNLLGEPLVIAPNGQQLVFALEGLSQDDAGSPVGQGARLMLLDLATRRARLLAQVQRPWDFEAVAWTGDGRYVMYSEFSNSRRDFSLMRVAVDGGSPEKVAEMRSWGAALSPDGARIAYTTGGTN